MLPDFPGIRRALDDAARYRVHMKTRSKSVIGALVHSITQHEGAQHSYHQKGTGTITQGYQAMSARFEISMAEVPHLIGEKLEARIDAMADEMARQTSHLFYETIGRETAKVGNSIDAGGGPMTQEMVLDMMERVDWSPDSVFIAHPVMAEAMQELWKEWEKDAAFMKKVKEVEYRKKEEWRDRESNRKLVD
jgi:hypothetical protein